MQTQISKIEENAPKKGKKRVFLVLIVLVFYIIHCYISYRGNYLEMKEIGEQYTDVFYKNLYYKVICSIVNFSFLFSVIFITTKIIKKGLKKFFIEENKAFPKLPNKSISFVVSIVVTMFISDTLTKKVMLFFNTGWFRTNRPNI